MSKDSQSVNLNLEAQQLKVVQESIVQSFRQHKKYIEKEITISINSITLLKRQNKNQAEILEGFNKQIECLNQLKIKYSDLVREEEDFFEKLKARTLHLQRVQNREVEFDSYFLKKLDRVLLDYMLRAGYFDSATLFAQNSNITDFSDLPVFQETQEIKRQLAGEQKCDKALQWCTLNRTKLNKNRSSMEFKLRMQEFVNLLHKQNDSFAAIKYARSNLVKFINSEAQQASSGEHAQHFQRQMEQVMAAMGLVAYPPAQRQELILYKEMTNEHRWVELAEKFEQESYTLYGLSPDAMVTQTLQTGISVLKTPFCEEKQQDELFFDSNVDRDVEMAQEINQNGACPTCDPNIRSLGVELPCAQLTQTSIACTITGELMDESNPPFYLPSGYLISKKAKDKLTYEFAEAKGGSPEIDPKLKCPLTEKVYRESDLRKVYFS